MAKRAPLYSWQIEVNEENNRLKREFIQSHGEELKLNKRYIDSYEKAVIKENSDLKNELLDEIIDDSNKEFVNNTKEKIFNDFKNYLETIDGYIDENEQEQFHLKYHDGENDFYIIAGIDKLIYSHNKNIDYQRIAFYKTLNGNRYISGVEREKLKSKYFYDNSVDGRIDKNNDKYIKKRKSEILLEFKTILENRKDVFTDSDIENLRSKYTEYNRVFFDEMGLKEDILKFNEYLLLKQSGNIFNIIKKKYESLDSPITSDDFSELKSDYSTIEWESIVRNYNNQFFIKKYESNKTIDDVYFLHEYYRKDDWKYLDSDKVKISKQMLDYKNGVTNSVIRFTNDLIRFIEEFANYDLGSNIKKIFLVSVPSSTKSRDNNSSMKRSINLIVKRYENGYFKLDYNPKLINLSDLLYRKENVKASHLYGERSYDKHFKTIGISKNKLNCSDDNIFIILDDVTTTGSIMNACADILINNGVKAEKIYKLAISATS